MGVVVKLRMALGEGVRDWEVRLTPRVVWIGVLRTEEVRFLVYVEEDMVGLKAELVYLEDKERGEKGYHLNYMSDEMISGPFS